MLGSSCKLEQYYENEVIYVKKSFANNMIIIIQVLCNNVEFINLLHKNINNENQEKSMYLKE